MPAKKCKCNMVWWVAWLVLATIALWCLVTGFVAQLTSAGMPLVEVAKAVTPWYFVGLLLFGLAKMAKWKCWSACMVNRR